MSAWLQSIAPVLGLLGFFLLWEAIVRLLDVPAFEVPAPSRVLREIVDHPNFYWHQALPTMREAALGLAIALVVALPLGSLLAHSRLAERAAWPVIVLVMVTPVVAYAPATVLWLGFGTKPILIVVALISGPPLILGTIGGLRSVDPATLELMESVNASRREVYFKLRFPSALPQLFTSTRVAVSLALVGALLGEFFAGVTEGLGWVISRSQANPIQQALPLWACVFVLAAMGTLAFTLVAVLERTLLHWHSSQQF
jgi:NitT/TauT family transport system permease protein